MNDEERKATSERLKALFDAMTPEEKASLEQLRKSYDNMTPEQKSILSSKSPIRALNDRFENRLADIGLNDLRKSKGLSPLYPNPYIEHYRKEMGLLPSNPGPTGEDMDRFSAYSRKCLAYYNRTGGIWPLTYKQEEQERRIKTFQEFQVFDSLDEIINEWDCRSGKIVEVKFVKPTSLDGWQSTIYQCATMVKVIKTLNHLMPTNLSRYNFIYQCKTLFKKTTHAFEYNAANFAFIVRTGLGSGGQEMKNIPVNFYEQAQEQLHHLLGVMKQELPQSHYERIFMLYVLIKDKRKAVL